MPFNTSNPIPSGDLRDLDDNARNIDTWANDKTKLSHPDRFGVERRTWHSIEQEANLNIQQAIDAKNAAQEAAMMSGFSKYADTLAQLEAGIGTDYLEGDVVMVFQDESRDDTSSIFKIESGVAEFKLTFDKTRQDLLSFTGNISADAEWSDVPAHSDQAFDVQAKALADRTAYIAKEITEPSGDEAIGGFDSIDKLRSYAGPAKSTELIGGPFAGPVSVDTSDTTSPDDGVVVFVDALSRRWKRTNISGKITLGMAGGVGGDGAADTVAFKKCLDVAAANGYIIDLENKFWKINEFVQGSWTSVKIIGSGKGSGLHFSTSTSGFEATAELQTLPSLTEKPVKFSDTLKFSANHNLVVGDTVVLRNTNANSFSNARSYYYDGQMVRVLRVDSNVQVTIAGTINANFDSVESTEVLKLTGNGLIFENLHIKVDSTRAVLIKFDGYANLSLDKISGDVGSAHTAISVTRCYGYYVGEVDIPVTSGNAYPVTISNSQRGRMLGPMSMSTRHSVAIGGGDTPGAVPSAGLTIQGGVLENLAANGIGAADMHGNVRDVHYIGSTINSMAVLSGDNTSYKNCQIYSVNSDSLSSQGMCVFGSELRGGVNAIENCTLFSNAGANPSYGQIHFVLVHDLKEDLHINISDVTIVHNNPDASNLRAIRLMISNGFTLSKKIYINIDGLTIRSNNSYAHILNISAPEDCADKITINMSNIDAPACPYVTFNLGISSVSSTVKMQLPSQSVSQRLDVTNGQTNVIHGAVTNFRHSYPEPNGIHISFSQSKDDVANFTGMTGGVIAVPYAYQRRIDGIRFGMRPVSSASFTAGDTVQVTAIASYDNMN